MKCGLEIHQQLEGRKLFCCCPTTNVRDKADVEVRRVLRASAGELGRVDQAAAAEMAKGRVFHYIGHSSDVCLVDLDEEPIHPVSLEALEAALLVARELRATPVDEVQFMRKIVVDGSNVSGFQRTALIATDGVLDTSQGPVKVPTICLEEEACQRVREGKGEVTFRLDRLGIPLIEIATAPDITSPEHAKETAERLGDILRSTGRCKRGLGSIRQDVNVSIPKGARVEIKGFQDLRSIPKVIEGEVKRQERLIKAAKKVVSEVRKAEKDFSTSFLRPMPGADRMYPETDHRTIPITAELKESLEKLSSVEDRVAALTKRGVEKVMALRIVRKDQDAATLDILASLPKLKPSFILDTFGGVRARLEKEKRISSKDVPDQAILDVLKAINDQAIPKSALVNALADTIKGTYDPKKYAGVDEKKLEAFVKGIVKDKPGMSPGAYMGLIMKEFKGKVDGKAASEILRKNIK